MSRAGARVRAALLCGPGAPCMMSPGMVRVPMFRLELQGSLGLELGLEQGLALGLRGAPAPAGSCSTTTPCAVRAALRVRSPPAAPQVTARACAGASHVFHVRHNVSQLPSSCASTAALPRTLQPPPPAPHPAPSSLSMGHPTTGVLVSPGAAPAHVEPMAPQGLVLPLGDVQGVVRAEDPSLPEGAALWVRLRSDPQVCALGRAGGVGISAWPG